MDDEFLTVADIARIVKVNEMTVRNWLDAGLLPSYRVGRRIRISRADFEAFIQAGISGDRPGPAASPSRASGTGTSRRPRHRSAST
jgi:excisionase family DNA binding protein